jgi:urea carboxylase-associated protein 2
MIEDQLFEDLLQPGATWSHNMKRGTSLRITDIQGNANVGAILYNRDNFAERYNMPDTLKAQHIARLTRGNVLYSDMGRILCSVTEDTVGWHDPLSGCSNETSVRAKYGEARYQEHRNDYHRNAYDSFVIELAKYGLGPRDMTAVNFFSKVVRMKPVQCISFPVIPARHVRTEGRMNVLVILNTCQHPLTQPEMN